jgi:hypothetical protein
MPLSCGPAAPGPLAQSESQSTVGDAPASDSEPSLADMVSSASLSRSLATLPALARAARLGSLGSSRAPAPAPAPMPMPMPPSPRPPPGREIAVLRNANAPERDAALHRRLAAVPGPEDGVLGTAAYQGRLLPLPPSAGTGARLQVRLGRLQPARAVPAQGAQVQAALAALSPRASARRGPSPRDRLLQQEQTRRLLTLRARLKSLSYGMGKGQNPWKLFSRYDRDNDGSLTLDEFTNAVRKGGQLNAAIMSDKELAKLFRAVDVDSSGRIEIQELTAFVWGEGASVHGGEGEGSTRPTRLARAEGSSTLASWRSTSVPAIASARSAGPGGQAMTPRKPAAASSGATPRVVPQQQHLTGGRSPVTQERHQFGVHPLWSKHERPYAEMVDAGSYAFWFGKTGDPYVKQLPGSSFATVV